MLENTLIDIQAHYMLGLASVASVTHAISHAECCTFYDFKEVQKHLLCWFDTTEKKKKLL